MTMKERWKDHPVYQCKVSDQGRVKGVWNWILTLQFHKTNGYYYCMVRKRGGKKFISKPVHQLVLETFVSERPEGHEVDHIDTIRTNNELKNLRWLPMPENRKGMLGKTAPGAKLKEGEVWLIKRILTYLNITHTDIAKMFPVVQRTAIQRIANGNMYKGVGNDH